MALDAHVGLLGRAEPVVQVVAPGRVEAHAVGRIRRQEPWLRAAEEPGHVVGVRRIAAQQAVVTEQPQLARLDVRLLGWLRDVVGIGEAGLAGTQIAEQPQEAGVVDRHLGEQFVELRLVGGRHRADRIERRQDEGLLLGREVDVQDGHRGLVPADRQRHPGVAVDHEAGPPVDHDLLDPAHRVERAGQGRLLVARMETPVAGVGQELVRRLLARADDPVAPACRVACAGSGRRITYADRDRVRTPHRHGTTIERAGRPMPEQGSLGAWELVRLADLPLGDAEDDRDGDWRATPRGRAGPR